MTENCEHHRVSRQLHTLLKSIGVFLVSILTVCLIFLVGPIVEGTYFPVTTDMEAQYIDSKERKMYFSVQANMVRDCVLIDVKALVDKDLTDGKKPVKGAAWEAEHVVSPYRIVTGYQDMGVWAVIPEGDRVIVSAVWYCHRFWDTRQVLGRWDRPKKD